MLGPLVVLDQERCILCTRCVRFMHEIPKEPQLGVFGRGGHELHRPFPGQPLDSNYSVNTVDICPVGALLSRDFRFRARVWFLSAAPSVCTGCSRGCNTFVDYMNGQDTYRYRPRENEAVNKELDVRPGPGSVQVPELGPRARRARGAGAVAKDPAARRPTAKAAAGCARGARAAGPGGARSPLRRLQRGPARRRDLREGGARRPRSSWAAAVTAGGRLPEARRQNPNRKGLELVAQALGLALRPFADLAKAVDAGKVRAVWAVGTEVPDPARPRRRSRRLEVLVAQAFDDGPVARQATVLLPASPHVESDGTFVNFDGRASGSSSRTTRAATRVRTGCSRPSSAARWGSCTASRRRVTCSCSWDPARRRARRVPLGLATVHPAEARHHPARGRHRRWPAPGLPRVACRPRRPRTLAAPSPDHQEEGK